MGTIKYDTPQGVLEFEITGDTPTPEEQEAIEASFSSPATETTEAPDPSTASYEELIEYYGDGGREEAPDFVPTVEGDVTDFADRWAFGKEDIPSEKEAFLTRTYGPNSFGKDNRGRYYLILDNLSP